MSKGVGKALEKAISSGEGRIPGQRGGGDQKFEFMNKNRQEIFQHLCIHPCSNKSEISRATDLSLHATNWHLRRLLESDYIHKMSVGKKTVFYPSEFIHTEDIPILEILNSKKAKAIYIVIIDSEGISQGEICDMLNLNHQAVIWYTKKLESLHMISSLEDGKFRRYYPTDLIKRKKDENSKRIKSFKKHLMKRFQKEMLSPTILRSTEEKLVVKLARGRSKVVLTLHTNPFITVLS